MARLEAWQRYRKASPCPVCGGYGAYKPENRCVGFLSADGEGAFCSQVADGRSPVWFEALGMDLYYHPFQETVRRERGRRPWRDDTRLGLFLQRREIRRLRREHEAARRPDWRDFG